jgi:hypothetical protein
MVQRRRMIGGVAGCALFAMPLVTGCGPGGATPIPEPLGAHGPVRDLDSSNISVKPADSGMLEITGSAATTSGGVTVSILDLDSTDPPSLTVSGADGSFDLEVHIKDGDEVRLQTTNGAIHSDPYDFEYQAPFTLLESAIADCLQVLPALSIEVRSGSQASLTIRNSCPLDAVLTSDRLRTNNGGFALMTALPITIPVGEQRAILLAAKSGSSPQSDVLFLDTTFATTAKRYAISVFSEP